jgi:uncharacterized protein (TIGR02996 family)
MNHDDAFLASIMESPEDDTPRLIYADWLEERGDARGEFVRLVCKLARRGKKTARRDGLEVRARELLAGQKDVWTAALVRLLDPIPWLKHVGQPTERDAEVYRIRSWDEWPGPEDQDVHAHYSLFQKCVDRLLTQAGPLQEEAEGLLGGVRSGVYNHAKQNVPLFDSDQDAWHGPSMSVWDVSYRASLFAVHLLLKQKMHAELIQAWTWVAAGHWPCGYAPGSRNRFGRLLMVY